ncbi:MAG: tyrosine-type recombinase/integrase [Parasphingorhabdus sp.]
MSIRKRKWTNARGEEKTAWQVDYRDNAGIRRAKQFEKKKQAEAWVTNAAWQVSQGIHTADRQSITVSDAAKYWLERPDHENLEPTTIAPYEQHIRLHINPVCGSVKLSQLTPPMIESFRDKFCHNLSYQMAKRVLRSFKAIISEAHRRGLIGHNPAISVKMPRRPREKSKVAIPSKQEIKAYLEAAEKDANQAAYPLACLLIFSGMRASEIRGLSWSKIDFSNRSVMVSTRADAKNLLGAPKTYTSHRIIPLPQVAISSLRAWKLACPPSDHDLVFPSIRGKVMSNDYLTRKLLAPPQAKAGITDGSCHKYGLKTLRHVAASLWIEQSATPKRVQNLMGHSSIQVTYDVYGHLFEQAQQDQKIADAISKALL